MTTTGIKWEDRYEQLEGLGEKQLFELARNEAVTLPFRKTAVELMQRKGYPVEKYRELAHLVAPVAVVHEDELPENIPEATPKASMENRIQLSTEDLGGYVESVQELLGPFTASVTTKTMSQPEVVQETFQKMEKVDA